MKQHLKRCSSIAKNKIMPVLDGMVRITIKNGSGTIQASDLDLFYTGSFRTSWADMDAVLPINRLEAAYDLLGEFTIRLNGDLATCKGEKGSITLTSIPVADWIEFPEAKGDPFTINIADMTPFCGKDEMRLSMMGICIGDGYTATDAHRLVHRNGLNVKNEIVIPATMAKWGNEILLDKTNVHFVHDDYTVTGRVIDAKYPNWKGVLPTDMPFEMRIDRKAMISLLKNPTIQKQSRVTFFDQNMICENVDDQLEIKIEAPVTMVGHISLNPSLFLSVLEWIPAETAVFGLTSASRAILWQSDDALALIMPVMGESEGLPAFPDLPKEEEKTVAPIRKLTPAEEIPAEEEIEEEIEEEEEDAEDVLESLGINLD